MNEHITLVHPDARDSAARAISSGFPIDLLNQSAGRLRVLDATCASFSSDGTADSRRTP